jgi:hypothetical protein
MQAQELLDVRNARGFKIAQTGQVKKNGNGWVVPSQSNGTSYNVEFSEFEHKHSCNCPDYQYRRIKCKHIFAVEVIVT